MILRHTYESNFPTIQYSNFYGFRMAICRNIDLRPSTCSNHWLNQKYIQSNPIKIAIPLYLFHLYGQNLKAT